MYKVAAANRSRVLLIVLSLTMAACGTQPGNHTSLHTFKDYSAVIDSIASLLRTGDVVVRRGRGPDSYMLAALNQRDQSWSHCGLVVFEDGYPFVYHCIGGEDNPDLRMRRDSANFFLTTTYNYAIGLFRYHLNGRQRAAIAQSVHSLYHQKPRFDLDFELSTDDKLYCSEMIWKVYTSALNDTSFIHPSWGHGRAYVGIDDLFLNGKAEFIAKVNFK